MLFLFHFFLFYPELVTQFPEVAPGYMISSRSPADFMPSFSVSNT